MTILPRFGWLTGCWLLATFCSQTVVAADGGPRSLEKLHSFEHEYTKLEDHNSDRAQKLRNEIIHATAKDTVWLTVEGRKPMRSELISLCKWLEGDRKFECRMGRSFPNADDSIHITETGLGEAIPIACGKTLRFEDVDAKPAPGLLKVGLGEAGDMHSHGYSHVIEAKIFPGSSFQIPCLKTLRGERILFAIFEDALGFRKHNWVATVQPAEKTKR